MKSIWLFQRMWWQQWVKLAASIPPPYKQLFLYLREHKQFLSTLLIDINATHTNINFIWFISEILKTLHFNGYTLIN
ncbi:hypothetical protein ACB098_02G047000 [Castanea mollissima]